jgi:hypothetical protein
MRRSKFRNGMKFPTGTEPRYALPMTDHNNPESESGKRRGPPPNPLYHPLFLPVLLVAFSLWFGWDGFLTTDPDMLEHQNFNRIMFVIMLPFCLWMVPRGIKEFREEQAAATAKQIDGKSP